MQTGQRRCAFPICPRYFSMNLHCTEDHRFGWWPPITICPLNYSSSCIVALSASVFHETAAYSRLCLTIPRSNMTDFWRAAQLYQWPHKFFVFFFPPPPHPTRFVQTDHLATAIYQNSIRVLEVRCFTEDVPRKVLHPPLPHVPWQAWEGNLCHRLCSSLCMNVCHFHTSVANSSKSQKWARGVTSCKRDLTAIYRRGEHPTIALSASTELTSPCFLTFLTYFLLKIKWLVLVHRSRRMTIEGCSMPIFWSIYEIHHQTMTIFFCMVPFHCTF